MFIGSIKLESAKRVSSSCRHSIRGSGMHSNWTWYFHGFAPRIPFCLWFCSNDHIFAFINYSLCLLLCCKYADLSTALNTIVIALIVQLSWILLGERKSRSTGLESLDSWSWEPRDSSKKSPEAAHTELLSDRLIFITVKMQSRILIWSNWSHRLQSAQVYVFVHDVIYGVLVLVSFKRFTFGALSHVMYGMSEITS